MESNDGSVVRLLFALTNKWPENKISDHFGNVGPILTTQELTMIVTGLRGMSTEHTIVETILNKLKSHIKHYKNEYISATNTSDYMFTGNQFATIFNSLQSMGGKISPNFDRNNTDMPSLLGFNLPMMHPKRRHSMSGKLLSFLTAITDVYEYSQERMTAAMIATSLYGFQVRSLSTMLALGIIVSS